MLVRSLEVGAAHAIGQMSQLPGDLCRITHAVLARAGRSQLNELLFDFDSETLVIDLEGMEDFRIDLRGIEPQMEKLGRQLEWEFDELEVEMGGLECDLEGLGRELEAEFGDLERDFGDAEWEQLSSEEPVLIERRVEEAMRTLKDRLSRIGDRPSECSF